MLLFGDDISEERDDPLVNHFIQKHHNNKKSFKTYGALELISRDGGHLGMGCLHMEAIAVIPGFSDVFKHEDPVNDRFLQT